MSHYRILRGPCVLGALIGALSFAQMNTAEVTGVVADATGGVIVHAAVTVVSSETNRKFASSTNDSGLFQIAEVPRGTIC